MFLENETVPMKWHSTNKKKYIERGYEFTYMGDTFYPLAKDVFECSSGAYIPVRCDYCGEIYYPTSRNYQKLHKDGEKDCCYNCRSAKIQSTVQEKYGVNCVLVYKPIQDQIKEKWMEKYGKTSPLANQEIFQKTVDSLNEHYNISKGIKELRHIKEISDKIAKTNMEKYGGVTAEAIVESAKKEISAIEASGYDNIVVSIKSSDVMMCVKAHELMAKDCRYPLHVGITEAGTLLSGNIKSSVGLGIILYEGIGDTIRVSLTGAPIEEIKSAKLILKTLGLRSGGIEVVSCPTCGRTQIDLISLAGKVENLVEQYPLDIKVAVMGCVVNGPGEAREADLGVAGGIGEGLLIKHGEVIRKVPEEELLDALREELEHWGE